MLKAGSTILSAWSGIDSLLAALILARVVILKGTFPILVVVFQESEVAGRDAKVAGSVNAFTIL